MYAVADPAIRKRRKKSGGNKKRNYTEGWVEFTSRRVAKMVEVMLNNRLIGELRDCVLVKWCNITSSFVSRRISVEY